MAQIKLIFIGSDDTVRRSLEQGPWKFESVQNLGQVTVSPDILVCQEERVPLADLQCWRGQFPDSLTLLALGPATLDQVITKYHVPGLTLLPRGFTPDDVAALYLEWQNQPTQNELQHAVARFAYFISHMPEMDVFLRLLAQRARTMEDVLLVGEGGSGRAQAAHFIHDSSVYRCVPFVELDCAAFFSRGGDESQLYTWLEQWCGSQQATAGGTVHLCGLDTLDSGLIQSLVHSVAQRWQRPASGLGSTWRLLLSLSPKSWQETPKNLLTQRAVHVLPLKARKMDIPLLAGYFFRNRRSLHFSPDAWLFMQAYDWPGNVRELFAVLCYLELQHSENTTVEVSDLPLTLAAMQACVGRLLECGVYAQRDAERLQCRLVWEALEHVPAQAAKALGLSAHQFSAIIKAI